MNVVEFIREQNEQFKAKLDSKFRNLTDLFNDKITVPLFNTLNNPWLSRIGINETEEPCEQQNDTPVVQTPEAAAMYEKLKAQLGQETFLGEWFTIDQECISQFAQVTGDDQWIHTNPERAAKESPFKSTIAHGFLTLSLLPKLSDTVNPKNNPYPEARMVINFGLNQVRFPFPVKAGSRVRVRTKLIGLVPMKKSIEVINEMSIEVENSKRLGCVAETVLRLYF
ncbi:MaoC family dehydratase [Thalassotalea aquiviva]|uniref:MaoC family dehydratase n=1 Tax=Thalassotalea aquiviva TaxID=3242415 RepID=UPI00352AB944